MTEFDSELMSVLQQAEESLRSKIAKAKEKKKKNNDLKVITRRQRENAGTHRGEVKRQAEAAYLSNLVTNLKNQKEASLDLVEKILLPQLTEVFLNFCEEQKLNVSGVKIILNCSKTNDSPDANVVLENNPVSRKFHKPSLQKLLTEEVGLGEALQALSSETEPNEETEESASPVEENSEAIVSLAQKEKLPHGWTLAIGKGPCSRCGKTTCARFKDNWIHFECFHEVP